MDPDEAIAQLEKLHTEAKAAVTLADSSAALEQLRIEYLGRRSRISEISGALGKMDDEARKRVGKLTNETRTGIESALSERLMVIEDSERGARLESEKIDVTLPGRRPEMGHRNPLTIVLDDIVDAFIGLGFNVEEGPEVETDWYNFQVLNIPEDHPARSMWDTLYVEPAKPGDPMPLMRTHTSPVQARVMEQRPPPVYVIVPGRVARRETLDAKRLASFHQIEGLAVDWGITFADLRGTLEAFAKTVFGPREKVRLRPSYFPFTEPSAEVDVLCFVCHGEGCRTCQREGWIEIMGAGMVHPNVFKAVGYPEGITGFAFGMGIERVAMPRYSVPDIRWFYENDLRFLRVFR